MILCTGSLVAACIRLYATGYNEIHVKTTPTSWAASPAW